jgi:hypothetical protein
MFFNKGSDMAIGKKWRLVAAGRGPKNWRNQHLLWK